MAEKPIVQKDEKTQNQKPATGSCGCGCLPKKRS